MVDVATLLIAIVFGLTIDGFATLGNLRVVLTNSASLAILGCARSLKKAGVAIIFISPALEEALTHADRLSVPRNGRMMVTGQNDGRESDCPSTFNCLIGCRPKLQCDAATSATVDTGLSAGT